MTESTDGSVVRLPGEGETVSLFGDTYTIKAAGDETGAALSVIEAELAPHSSGTPLHVNTREAENYYVLEGTLTFRIGERTVEAPAGLVRPHPPGRRPHALECHHRARETPRHPGSGRLREVLRGLRRAHGDDAARPSGHEQGRGALRDVRASGRRAAAGRGQLNGRSTAPRARARTSRGSSPCPRGAPSRATATSRRRGTACPLPARPRPASARGDRRRGAPPRRPAPRRRRRPRRRSRSPSASACSTLSARSTPSAPASQSGCRVTTTVVRPGSGRPTASYVRRPMTRTWPSVSSLKSGSSSGRCQGRPPSTPITPLRATATRIVTGIL